MTYKDKTFCASEDCTNVDCHRHSSNIDWEPHFVPRSWADFSDTCEDYEVEIDE